MEIEQVKEYLRVDFPDDDNMIAGMMAAAKSYIEAAVGVCDMENPRARMLLLAIVQDFYDSRTLMVTEQQKKRIAYMYASIILQLQMEVL